jgi:hypothetical protein
LWAISCSPPGRILLWFSIAKSVVLAGGTCDDAISSRFLAAQLWRGRLLYVRSNLTAGAAFAGIGDDVEGQF